MDNDINAQNSDRNELLGKLYALRAGISVVSQEKNIIDSIVNNAKEECRRLENECIEACDRVNNACAEQVKNIESELSNYDNAVNKKRGSIDNTNRNKSEINSLKQELKTPFTLFIVCFAVFLVSTVAMTVVLILDSELIYVWFPLAFVGLVMLIASIVRSVKVKNMKQEINYLRKSVANIDIGLLQNELDKLEEELREKQEEIARRTSAIESQAENDKNDIINKANKQKEEIINAAFAETMPHYNAAKEYAATLVNSFGGLLDSRDWESLDLFIYAIETRRANDIGSAFSYVDSERRADRLVTALQFASKQISMSIESGLGRLGDSVNSGFAFVSQNVMALGGMLEQQSKRISAIDDNMQEQSKQLSELAETQRLGNALAEKADTSSAQLAADVSAIKNKTNYIEAIMKNIK